MVTFLRSPSTAPRVFGFDSPGQLVRHVPRVKFLFFVEFNLSAGGAAMIGSSGQTNLNTWKNDKGISFKVKSVDKPKINLQHETLNQYNKKRIVYKRAEYEPMSLRLYDTVDNSVLSMWVDYFTYFFGDSRPKNILAYNQSPVNGKFVDSTGWGLRPLTNDTQFFEDITVYAFYARTYTSFSYINPKITSIDWQNRDYSQSDPEEVNITFSYEAIEYNAFGKEANEAQIEAWGWSELDQLAEPAPPPIAPSTAKPRIFENPISTSITAPPLDIELPVQNNNTLVVWRASQNTFPQDPDIFPNSVSTTASNPTFAGATPQFGDLTPDQFTTIESEPLDEVDQELAEIANRRRQREQIGQENINKLRQGVRSGQ